MVRASARTRRPRSRRRRCRTPSRRRPGPPERRSSRVGPFDGPARRESLVPSLAYDCQSSNPGEPAPPPRGPTDGRIPSHPTPAPHRFARRVPHRAGHPRRSLRPRTRVPDTVTPRSCPWDARRNAALPPAGRRLPAICPRAPTSDRTPHRPPLPRTGVHSFLTPPRRIERRFPDSAPSCYRGARKSAAARPTPVRRGHKTFIQSGELF